MPSERSAGILSERPFTAHSYWPDDDADLERIQSMTSLFHHRTARWPTGIGRGKAPRFIIA